MADAKAVAVAGAKAVKKTGKRKAETARPSQQLKQEVVSELAKATEDDVARAEKELDKLTHAQEAEIDKALEQK